MLHAPDRTDSLAITTLRSEARIPGEGVGGHLLHRVVGNVGDNDPGVGGCLQVDVVESDSVSER